MTLEYQGVYLRTAIDVKRAGVFPVYARKYHGRWIEHVEVVNTVITSCRVTKSNIKEVHKFFTNQFL